jgi:NAD+ synthase (glutamine-hydrolysing)
MARNFKLVMAQLNLIVGDIDANANRVIACARRAIDEQSADMIVFPELTLTGYPPEDLLFRPSLKLRVDKALQKILAANLDIYMVLGYPRKVEDKLYNALSVIRGSDQLGVYHKQLLPSYEVFDEHRYFAPGDEPLLLDIAGSRMAFTVCEDMWGPGPAVQAREGGAQLLININASPYHINKLTERQVLLKKRSQESGCPIVYVNLVGGQDELVFDGGSMAVDASGTCQALVPSYMEGQYPLDIQIDSRGECAIPRQEIAAAQQVEAQIYKALVLGVRDYVNKNGFSGVVLGLSGGIDSALTLAVAVDALGKDRVQAVMMPFEYTSKLSLDVAAQQAATLGVNYQVIAINEIYAAFMAALQSEFAGTESGISEQNLQARARGVLLMGISNKKGLLVLTTGNKSEIAVGYSTLYGDMAGGFDVLKDVSKTMVYRLARYRNMSPDNSAGEVIPQSVIDRPPSAELAPDQVDQDSLPPYDVLDQILELYVEQDYSAAAIIAQGFEESQVKRVLRLVDLNEYKRRQSPIGVRLTRKGFGRDRRYPITNAWPIGD